MCKCMLMCVCVYMYACGCAWMYVYARVCWCVCVRARTSMCIMCVEGGGVVCACVCIYVCMCMYICTCVCVHVHTCVGGGGLCVLVYIYWSFLYSAIPCSWAGSLRSHLILHEWIASFFYSAFLNIHRSGVLTALAWLVPQESAARESQSRRILCTPYKHAPCHFMQSHIRKVYACLAVTCHLRFSQNDRGLLRATAVTRGWNGYRIRVSTESWPWRRKFSRRSSRDSNPRPFDRESSALSTELSPLRVYVYIRVCACMCMCVCGGGGGVGECVFLR